MIGIEAVEDIGKAGKCSEQTSCNRPLAKRGHFQGQYSQGLNLSLEERVWRRSQFAGTLRKPRDF